MAWYDRFLLRKESAFAGVIAAQYAPGQAQWTSDDFARLAREGFRISPYVYTCVSGISQGAAGIPLTCFEENRGRSMKGLYTHLAGLTPQARHKAVKGMLARKDLVERPNHTMLQRLANPNPLYGGSALIEGHFAYRLISGNAYMEAVGPENRPPVELYTHRPDRMQVVPGPASDPILGYEYSAGGLRRRIEATAIQHWRTFNPLDDHYGLAPLVAAARSVDMGNSARAWNVSLTQNGARPSGILMIQGGEGAQTASVPAFIESLRSWVGAKNVGKPGVLAAPRGSKLEWVQTAFSPLDISWMEGLKLSAREVAMVFRYPFVLLDPDASTFSNQSEGRKALYQECILPLMDSFTGEWNWKMSPKWGDRLILGYDLDQIEAMREDQDKLHARVQKDWVAGILTLNESRVALGYDEVPEPLGASYYWQLVALRKPASPGSEDEHPADSGKSEVIDLVARMKAAM